jgi:hypothetical protein
MDTCFHRFGREFGLHMLAAAVAGIVLTALSINLFGVTLEEQVREWLRPVRTDWTTSLDALKEGATLLEAKPWMAPGRKNPQEFDPLDWDSLRNLLQV